MAVAQVDDKLKRFLDLIAWSEGTSTNPITQNNGYDVIVSGVNGHNSFTDYSTHPFSNGREPIEVRPGLYSTASGRYQLMLHWWGPYKKILLLNDFSPLSQDKIALQQISERRATNLILGGDIKSAIYACSNIWASFPGNSYNQGGRSLVELLSKY